jgi:hypothetical protein
MSRGTGQNAVWLAVKVRLPVVKYTGKQRARENIPMRKTGMIADSFDSRTLANMEVALERAWKALAVGSEEHSARRHIASKILQCARRGDKTLGGLTEAGYIAATELSATHGN